MTTPLTTPLSSTPAAAAATARAAVGRRRRGTAVTPSSQRPTPAQQHLLYNL